MKLVLFLTTFMVLCGCAKGCTSLPVKAKTPAEPPTVEESVERAVQDRTEAEKEGDRLAILEAEKRELRARLAKASKDVHDLDESLAAKDKEIKNERLDRTQNRAYLVAGVSGFIGVICLAASFFITIPFLAKVARGASGVCMVLGFLALAFAWLVPYLFPITIGVGILVAAVVLWQWKADHKSLDQVVRAVEPLKLRLQGASEELRGALGKDVQKRVNAIRIVAGLKKNT